MKRRGSSNTFFSSNGIALLFIVFSFLSFGQIDSVSVTVQFETGLNPYDNLTTDVLSIDVNIYDIDFMGDIGIVVYDTNYDFPMENVVKTAQECITENLISGDTVTLKIYGLNPQQSLRIETMVRNEQGGYFPIISTDYNAQ
jgi:hypothetical protein